MRRMADCNESIGLATQECHLYYLPCQCVRKPKRGFRFVQLTIIPNAIRPESKLPIRVTNRADNTYRARASGTSPKPITKSPWNSARIRRRASAKIYLDGRSLTDLGLLLEDKGDYEAALPHLEQALEIRQKELGSKHAATAHFAGLCRLGALGPRRLRGSAGPELEEALAVQRELLPAKDPQIAVTLTYLGNLLATMGDQKSARPYIEEGLNIRKEVFGPNHRDTATSLEAMAGLLQGEGDYSAARAYYQQSLEIRKESYRAPAPHCGQIVEQFRGIVPRHWRLLVGPQLLRASAGHSQTSAGIKAPGHHRHAL